MWAYGTPIRGYSRLGQNSLTQQFTRENPRNLLGICDMNFVPVSDPVQQAQREYLESRILSAQPAELVEMLYQVAIQSLKKAIGHLKSGDAMARSREVTRAQEAVNELMAALDHSVGAAFTHTLAALYAYVQQQILKGHSGPSQEAFDRAMGILNTLQEGWNGVCGELIKTRQAVSHPARSSEPSPAETGSAAAGDRAGEYCQEPVPVPSRDWSA
jgi:flagellar secretion chaperone FliS